MIVWPIEKGGELSALICRYRFSTSICRPRPSLSGAMLRRSTALLGLYCVVVDGRHCLHPFQVYLLGVRQCYQCHRGSTFLGRLLHNELFFTWMLFIHFSEDSLLKLGGNLATQDWDSMARRIYAPVVDFTRVS